VWVRAADLLSPAAPSRELVSSGHAAMARGGERNRRAGVSAGTALGARVIILGISLVSIPLALGYLGPERYGMWFTISSIVALLSFTDLGIGYGLLNALSRATALGDRELARRQVSSSIALLAMLAVVIAGLFAAAYPRVSWDTVLAVTSQQARAEAGPSVWAFVAIFLVSLPLTVVTQVRAARQELYLVHLTAAAGNIASLALLILAIQARQGVPVLVVAMAGPPMLAVVLNGAILFRNHAPELRPSLQLVDLGAGVGLMRIGVLFLILQVSMTVAFSTDTLVIAQILGPTAVAQYGVALRLFEIPIGLVAVVASPLWPAYGEAIARRDVSWAEITLRRSLRMAIAIAFPMAVLLVVAGAWIIEVWAGPFVVPPLLLLVAMGIWAVQSSIGHTVAMFLNGANEVRMQALAAVGMAFANLGLSIWLTARIGVAGVVWGTVIAYGIFVLVPMAIYVPRVLARIRADDASTAAPGGQFQAGDQAHSENGVGSDGAV